MSEDWVGIKCEHVCIVDVSDDLIGMLSTMSLLGPNIPDECHLLIFR
jgi:hypothetical protein